MIILAPGTSEAIKSFFVDNGFEGPLSIRIDIRSTGCCDPSLGLSLDSPGETDLIEVSEGLIFTMNPEIYRLTGDVTISYSEGSATRGFVIRSRKPVSEWDGFGTTCIQI
jgi:Fe-S cluster assembly iron-binding protein IscA